MDNADSFRSMNPSIILGSWSQVVRLPCSQSTGVAVLFPCMHHRICWRAEPDEAGVQPAAGDGCAGREAAQHHVSNVAAAAEVVATQRKQECLCKSDAFHSQRAGRAEAVAGPWGHWGRCTVHCSRRGA